MKQKAKLVFCNQPKVNVVLGRQICDFALFPSVRIYGSRESAQKLTFKAKTAESLASMGLPPLAVAG